MRGVKIGFPGLGSRLKHARTAANFSQEAVAELLGVSRVTVYRWERDQRTIAKDHLARLGEQYGRPMRWFLTFEEGDIDPMDVRYDTARRIYRRISEMPERYRALVERVVDEMVVGLDTTEE